MSCGCENRERWRELERVRRLAEKAARLTGETHCIIERDDGTYRFVRMADITNEKIIEYII